MSDQNQQDELAELQQLYEGGSLSKELYLAAIKGLGLDSSVPGVTDAQLEGAGAIAQGPGAVAASAGGVAVGGNVGGHFIFFGKNARLENVQIQLHPDTGKALQDTLCDAVERLDKELYEDIKHFERMPPAEPYRYLYSFDTCQPSDSTSTPVSKADDSNPDYIQFGRGISGHIELLLIDLRERISIFCLICAGCHAGTNEACTGNPRLF